MKIKISFFPAINGLRVRLQDAVELAATLKLFKSGR
jgi:hypothetical protein